MLSTQPSAVPRFAPQWAVAKIDEQTLIVQSETRRAALRGRAVVIVAEAIDGLRPVAELAERLAPRLSMPDLAYVLDLLERSGYLVAANPPVAEEQIFWSSQALPEAPQRLENTGVALTVLSAGGETAARMLEQAGLRCGDGADLAILLCDDYLQPGVAEQMEQISGPLLIAKISGLQPTIGPLLEPTEGPCRQCLLDAVRWNRPVQELTRRRGAAAPLPAPSSAASLTVAAGTLAMVAARIAAGDRKMRDTLLSLNLSTQQTQLHRVRRRPQCPICGNPAWMREQAARPPELEAVEIAYQTDGGYRCRTPQDTWESYRHLISPLTGVVNYLHPMPGRHGGMRKVYVSGYQVCPQVLSANESFDRICAGKGQSDEQARSSALCEALERVSSVWQGDEWLRMASRAELLRAGETALSFDQLQNFSARQFAQRERTNAATNDRRRQVPEPADDGAVIGWTQGWSLHGAGRCFVPAVHCFAETPMQLGGAYGIYNPNGTAAGNCLEEAILQGMLELIERDATAIWWYNRLPRPALDLDAVDDPFTQNLRREYAKEGWSLRVIDLTHDLGIAVHAAVAHHDRLQRHAIGFGCHLKPRLALSRALTELNQLLDARAEAPHPWDIGRLPEADFLHPAATIGIAPDGDGGVDLRQDIATCLQRLRAAGIDAYLVNKSRPDIGLSVVQVLLPGLRHFWPRFGPGRLYDVPVAMGWRAKATAEEDLNPAPLFL